MQTSIALWLFGIDIVLSVLVVVLFVQIRKQTAKLTRFMRGKDASTLEDTLSWLIKKHAEFDDAVGVHKEALEQLDHRLKKSIQTPPLIPFNAHDSGGHNQSFATAFLDEEGNGYILSVHMYRTHMAMYAKPIARFIPTLTLTEEEREALTHAQK